VLQEAQAAFSEAQRQVTVLYDVAFKAHAAGLI